MNQSSERILYKGTYKMYTIHFFPNEGKTNLSETSGFPESVGSLWLTPSSVAGYLEIAIF